jgi:hypothetical protein
MTITISDFTSGLTANVKIGSCSAICTAKPVSRLRMKASERACVSKVGGIE